MKYDYSKLKAKMVENNLTQAALAEKIGLSERTMSLKMNGKREWKQSEIERLRNMLKIPKNEITNYFFALTVQ